MPHCLTQVNKFESINNRTVTNGLTNRTVNGAASSRLGSPKKDFVRVASRQCQSGTNGPTCAPGHGAEKDWTNQTIEWCR